MLKRFPDTTSISSLISWLLTWSRLSATMILSLSRRLLSMFLVWLQPFVLVQHLAFRFFIRPSNGYCWFVHNQLGTSKSSYWWSVTTIVFQRTCTIRRIFKSRSWSELIYRVVAKRTWLFSRFVLMGHLKHLVLIGNSTALAYRLIYHTPPFLNRNFSLIQSVPKKRHILTFRFFLIMEHPTSSEIIFVFRWFIHSQQYSILRILMLFSCLLQEISSIPSSVLEQRKRILAFYFKTRKICVLFFKHHYWSYHILSFLNLQFCCYTECSLKAWPSVMYFLFF